MRSYVSDIILSLCGPLLPDEGFNLRRNIGTILAECLIHLVWLDEPNLYGHSCQRIYNGMHFAWNKLQIMYVKH